MKQLTLSNRLSAIAALIGDRHGVADVGTDHGFLPAWLALYKKTRRLIAADVRKGPLARARKTAEEYGVSEAIDFVLADGLTGITPEGLDTIVIAGMGGETIVHILQQAPWIKSENVLCVLQPQTKTDDLLDYLRVTGFSLLDASLASDDGRYYLILAARAGDTTGVESPQDILFRKHDPLLPRWLDREITKLQRVIDGLAHAETHREGDMDEKKAALEALLTMKEETDKWHR